MAGFAGFDVDIFPGADQMAWLKANTNFVWCGYYLFPAPFHSDGSWMGQRASLVAAGWGMAPVYLGQQTSVPNMLTSEQGTTDGNQAASLMTSEGFPAGSCVYLDLENGPPFQAPQTAYVAAWVAAVTAAGFTPGIYCSHGMAAQVQAANPAARIWAFKVATTASHPVAGPPFPDSDPAGSGFPGATIWQLDDEAQLSLPGAPSPSMTVDLDSASMADPSAPPAAG